ncbi:hypothetical protein LO762_03065 [Actinocorallia sp. API 0066]|uniref:hypothetical protein n=1 Tax=Actinocorallia sp. API 0066 TaxID=2896846 RepID=UPI001E479859|nr:hypothetical protein [Actinocorallia sp. API 0066]MCD0448182.1 hypothetical protein [Actinocorallia sp. API 0066]
MGGLANLPALYDDCVRREETGTLQVRRRGSRKNRSIDPMSPAAVDTRAAIRVVLEHWAGLVASERRVQPPDRDIRVLTGFLRRHAEWLAAHPAAAEAVDEIRDLVLSARRAAYPKGGARSRVGSCPNCSGELVALIRAGDDALPSEIVCTSVPEHAWPAARWATLAREMRRGTR